VPGPGGAARFDTANIVRTHRAELEAEQRLDFRQRRVLTDIAQCRTEVLGGHREQCTSCDFERVVYLSCRNRHCPKCQALAQEKWIENQRERMLDVKHFHVVFTLPAELRPLAAFAPRVVYDILFHAVARTLLEFGTTRLSATIGATLVLHTWTRDLRFHPHVHAIVTAGGLALRSLQYVTRGRNFLFPVRAMATVFRAKVLAALWDAHRAGAFGAFDADPEAFELLIGRVPKKWNVYAKPSFDQGRHVIAYLGRYTHRVGIANSRLLNVTADAVTFRTRGAATATVTPVEFLRRFVRHVLPDGFHKIRHVGLNASLAKRERAREALAQPLPPRTLRSWQERLTLLTAHDVRQCPHCKGALQAVALAPTRARSPPSLVIQQAAA
jgi:hypothetical protein